MCENEEKKYSEKFNQIKYVICGAQSKEIEIFSSEFDDWDKFQVVGMCTERGYIYGNFSYLMLSKLNTMNSCTQHRPDRE